jgi:hypothetical protein
MNSTSAKGFAAGQPMWMYDTQGLKMFTLVQNRATTAASFSRGNMISRVGGASGVTLTTVSTATTTQIAHSSNSYVANQWVGATVYLTSTGSTAAATPEAESSVVVSNTTAAINFNANYPFSTTPGAGLTATIISNYNARLASSGDLSNTVLGACVPQNGITSGNFGFVQSYGPCYRVNKDTTTTAGLILGAGIPLIINTVSAGVTTGIAGTLMNLVVGRALSLASSVATDAAVFLNCAQLFPNFGTGTTAIV